MLRCCSNEVAQGPGATIQDGDEVIVLISREDVRALLVTKDGKFDCKFGCFKMRDWIGKPFGSRVQSLSKTGFVHLLAPTTELWTQALRHRTQILYSADISLATSYMELAPGRTVLESGTGSGSLSHSLARAVAPGGHVFTYEFHAERVSEARKEFAAHKLEEVVSIEQRDIEANGFPDQHHGNVDAVFLDLPGPWKVVESAAKCLKPDGRICSFSPCIEQVQRTCGALSRAGFYKVRTMECLLRQYEVKNVQCTADVFAASPLSHRQKRKRGLPDQAQKPAEAGSSEHSYLQIKPTSFARGHTGYLTFARRIVDVENAPASEPPINTEEALEEQ